MKIAVVVNGLNRGGIEIFVLEFAKKMIDRHEIVVYTFSTYGVIEEQLHQIGITIRRIEGNIFYKFIKMLYYFAIDNPKLIYSHVHYFSSVVHVATRITGIKSHITLFHASLDRHKNNTKKRILFWIASKFMNKSNIEIHVCSKFARDSICQLYGLDKRKTKIRYLGIDTEKFKPSACMRKSIRNNLGVSESDFLIGSVANFVTAKNHKLVVNAFYKAFKYGKELLVLVGKGPLLSEIKKEIDILGISDRVKILGSRDDICDLLNAFDTYIIGSITEGIPLAMLEAMSTRLPVISTNVGGISEVNNDCIKLIANNDMCGMSEALKTMRKNIILRRKMGNMSRKVIIDSFNINLSVNIIEKDMLSNKDCKPPLITAM